MSQDWFAFAARVLVLTHRRPAIGTPLHRLQMYDATVGRDFLKVDEPVFARRGIDPSTLVGTIHGRAPLFEHDARFIGTPNIARAKNGLETFGNTARRREHVVETVTLVEFRPFEGIPPRKLVGIN